MTLPHSPAGTALVPEVSVFAEVCLIDPVARIESVKVAVPRVRLPLAFLFASPVTFDFLFVCLCFAAAAAAALVVAAALVDEAGKQAPLPAQTSSFQDGG